MRIMTHFRSLIFVLLSLSELVWSTQDGDPATYAVLDFDAMGVSRSESEVLASRLRSELVRTKGVTVVERNQMSQILMEQDFQLEGCTSDECAVEVGQLLGVTIMIAGSLGKLGSTYSVDLRAIDVATRKITKSVIRDYKGEIDVLLSVMSSIAVELVSDQSAGASTGQTVISSIPTANIDLSTPGQLNDLGAIKIGDLVIVHVLVSVNFDIGIRSYLVKGKVMGIHSTDDIVQIRVGKDSELLAQSRNIYLVSNLAFSIGSKFTVGDKVTYFSDGYHQGTVNKINGANITIVAVEVIDGLQYNRKKIIRRNLIVSHLNQ